MTFVNSIENGFAVISGLTSGIPALLLSVTGYILSALALYTLAERRGIRNAWLSWIPVANIWVLGSLSDQYRYVVLGEIRSSRKKLLFLKILNAALSLAVLAAIFTFVLMVVLSAGSDTGPLRSSLISALILGAVFAVVKLVLTVMQFIALYDVYRSCDPSNAVLYLVFSILFGFTQPFFLFFNRDKELGMPPRRDDPRINPQTFYSDTQ